jgi:hypothetical protein
LLGGDTPQGINNALMIVTKLAEQKSYIFLLFLRVWARPPFNLPALSLRRATWISA